MAKAPVSGPSKGGGRPVKAIHKTVDLLRQNQGEKRKGKGKEKEVLGDVMSLVDDVSRLPSMIQVEKFAETRAMEINAFQTAIKLAAAQGSTRAFQSLPRHLRRRAASHNPRRVPKRLRIRAAMEIDAGDVIAKKHRKVARMRQKGSLRDHASRTEQFALRQKDKTWLSTHIWHSKRYHMANLWGYRLPVTPTLKSFRPACRAGRRKVIGFDTSYFGIIEVEGKRKDIVSMLARISTGAYAGSRYEDGSRVANITLYHYDAFPAGLIGPAEVLWCPDGRHTQASCRLWLRLHPSIYNEVWDVLKVASRQLFQAGSTSASTPMQIRDLRGEINSLDIMGPRAGHVIKRVLKLCRSELKVKTSFFDSLDVMQDASSLDEGLVAGVTIHDPRLNFPPQRPALAERDCDEQLLRAKRYEPSSQLASSDLWNSDIRDDKSKAAYTKYQLDARRHRLGLPGTRLRPQTTDDRIPVLLFQRSISNRQHPSDGFYGFTLMLPAGPWAQYLLFSLLYSGTLIAGLEERRVQHREAGLPCFPEHFGQTCHAGSEWETARAARDKETWDRKPPGKRPEFAALATRNPFKPDWSAIFDHCKSTGEEAMLNGDVLPKPWLLPSLFAQHITAGLDPVGLHRMINAYRSQRRMPSVNVPSVRALFNTALVQVEITVHGRGSPGNMAVIYALPADHRHMWIEAFERGEPVGAGDDSKLHRLGEEVPSETAVIGHVDTGNFSLSRGAGHALATVSLEGWLGALAASTTIGGNASWQGRALVRVRNRDGRVCRLAELRVV
ncbi:hypothetical protein IAU60_003828 [Kwoniella sp. DSM 27419]